MEFILTEAIEPDLFSLISSLGFVIKATKLADFDKIFEEKLTDKDKEWIEKNST